MVKTFKKYFYFEKGIQLFLSNIRPGNYQILRSGKASPMFINVITFLQALQSGGYQGQKKWLMTCPIKIQAKTNVAFPCALPKVSRNIEFDYLLTKIT